VVQLLLNYTSVGCAGFSALTPYRGAFRAATLSLLACLLWQHGLSRRSLATLLLSTSLMLSQDVLAAHNRGLLSPAGLQAWVAKASSGSSMLAPWQQLQQQQPAASTRTRLRVSGLRCEACAARLRGSIAAVPGVDDARVSFDEGLVEVWSNRSEAVSTDALQAAVAATDAAYTAEVVGRDCFDARDQQHPCAAPAPATAGSSSHQPAPATPAAAAADAATALEQRQGGAPGSSSCRGEL
jgi:copper chaperone CopZ